MENLKRTVLGNTRSHSSPVSKRAETPPLGHGRMVEMWKERENGSI